MGVVGEYDLGKIALRIKLFFFISEKRKTRGGGGELSPDQFRTLWLFYTQQREDKKKDEHVASREKKNKKKNKQFLGFLPQYTSNVTEQKNILLFLIFQEKKKARGIKLNFFLFLILL